MYQKSFIRLRALCATTPELRVSAGPVWILITFIWKSDRRHTTSINKVKMKFDVFHFTLSGARASSGAMRLGPSVLFVCLTDSSANCCCWRCVQQKSRHFHQVFKALIRPPPPVPIQSPWHFGDASTLFAAPPDQRSHGVNNHFEFHEKCTARRVRRPLNGNTDHFASP